MSDVNVFRRLMNAGSWVRNNVASDISPERPILHELQSYYKWSLRDGEIQQKEHIPVIAIVTTTNADESVRKLVHRLTKKLHALGKQYRAKWLDHACNQDNGDERYVHELPTMYGFLIKSSVLSIVTYDSAKGDFPIKTVISMDWARKGQAFWYALAVAITMVRARNYLIQLDEEGELGPEIVESDPDL